MPTVKRKFATLTFTGPKFEDHGLDIDALPELIAYKGILIETAKQLWRRNNPRRERLPKGFEESVSIKFYELREGSTTVPLVRELEYQDGELPFHAEDEVDRAARIIDESIDAVSKGNALPEDFPKESIPLFNEFGKTLSPGHGIRIRSSSRREPAFYTPEVRENLMNWSERSFEDKVDLTGEVRVADLDGCNFRLRLEDGGKVDGRFTPEQESLITKGLREHTTRRLRVRGTGEYSQPDKKLKRITSVSDISILPAGKEVFDKTARPVWEIVLQIADGVPEEELRKLPSDASVNLDHYLYGVPKKP